ncbi:hypothetical protein AB0F77_02550 [Streptomyces sp. NPDC026672]|uniref:hypothetical protein n=1 Tax=unclassified Streptomyces TaxID=2593676 RepID=UPI0033DFD5D4
MCAHRVRVVRVLAVVGLLVAGSGAVVGCGGERSGGAHGPVGEAASRREDRVRQVADAWEGSAAVRVWRRGYQPLEAAVQLPEGGLHGADDRLAYRRGNFALGGELPGTPRGDGRVVWRNGDSLALPLVGADRALRGLDRADSPGPRLTVTGARPGEMTLGATNRGPATVPAWLFTLKGYGTPLKVAAVAPSRLPAPPVGPVRGLPADVLAPLDGLTEVSGDGRSLTVVATHGSCDDGPAVDVRETGTAVVLSAYVVGTKDGPCTDELRGERVTVRLERPMGERVVLDASTGRPVTHRDVPVIRGAQE